MGKMENLTFYMSWILNIELHVTPIWKIYAQTMYFGKSKVLKKLFQRFLVKSRLLL